MIVMVMPPQSNNNSSVLPSFTKKKVWHPQKNDDKKGLEMPKIVKSSPTILPILSIAFLFFPIQYSSVYHHHHHGQLV